MHLLGVHAEWFQCVPLVARFAVAAATKNVGIWSVRGRCNRTNELHSIGFILCMQKSFEINSSFSTIFLWFTLRPSDAPMERAEKTFRFYSLELWIEAWHRPLFLFCKVLHRKMRLTRSQLGPVAGIFHLVQLKCRINQSITAFENGISGSFFFSQWNVGRHRQSTQQTRDNSQHPIACTSFVRRLLHTINVNFDFTWAESNQVESRRHFAVYDWQSNTYLAMQECVNGAIRFEQMKFLWIYYAIGGHRRHTYVNRQSKRPILCRRHRRLVSAMSLTWRSHMEENPFRKMSGVRSSVLRKTSNIDLLLCAVDVATMA